jgi:general secretion pathway protein G
MAALPRALFHRRPQRQRGFTLIELLLVLALVALLATIALPTYRAYVNRAKVAAAVGDLGRMKLRVDAWRLAHNDALPATLADIDMAGLLDPWGFPYVYFPFAGQNGNGGVRKDKNLVPINTSYDLYSVGADGASVPPITAKPSQDDVIMANDGGYMGLASGY